MRPSIALPTGPYDWNAERHPTAVFEERVALLRRVLSERGLTHAIVHGNGFDHEALLWLTHLTPKLGPAYALVPAGGTLRVLFSGGPGMKPSAQRLTWVEDVVALKSIAGDVAAWLGAGSESGSFKVGLVEGGSMLRGDFAAVKHAAGDVVLLDDAVAALRDGTESARAAAAAAQTMQVAVRRLAELAKRGADVRRIIIDVERAAYEAGAQDVRMLVGRRPHGPPTTPPDAPLAFEGPSVFAIFVRQDGAWAEQRVVQDARD